MKPVVLLSIATLCFASCFTTANRQVAATYNGAVLGGMIGSAVGELAGGEQSSALGNVIGMVAGGVIGHAVTAPKHKQTQQKERSVEAAWAANATPSSTNPTARVVIEDIAIYEDVTDAVLAPGERVEIVYVLHNTTPNTVTNIIPTVRAKPAKHLLISPAQTIAKLPPNGKIRYTTFVQVKPGIKRKPITFTVTIDERGHRADEKQFTLQGREARP